MMLLAGFDGGQTSIRCRLSQWDDGRWLLRDINWQPVL